MISNSHCFIEIDHRYTDCEFAQTSLKQMSQISDAIFGYTHKTLAIFIDDVHTSSSKLTVKDLVDDYKYFFDEESIQIEVYYESEFSSITHPSREIAHKWLKAMGSEVVETFDRGERQQVCIKYFDCHSQPALFPIYHIVDGEMIPTCALLSFTWWVHRYEQCRYNTQYTKEPIEQCVITIIDRQYYKIENKVQHLVYELYHRYIIPDPNIKFLWIDKEQ